MSRVHGPDQPGQRLSVDAAVEPRAAAVVQPQLDQNRPRRRVRACGLRACCEIRRQENGPAIRRPWAPLLQIPPPAADLRPRDLVALRDLGHRGTADVDLQKDPERLFLAPPPAPLDTRNFPRMAAPLQDTSPTTSLRTCLSSEPLNQAHAVNRPVTHGISRLPDVEGDRPKRQKFKRYPIGFFHMK